MEAILKKAIALVIVLVMSLSLVGCGSTADPVLNLVDLPSLSSEIKESTEFKDELNSVSDSVFFNLYGIDAADVKEAYNYLSGGGTAEELVIIDAVDEAAAEKIFATFDARIEYQINIYESYAPVEVERLENALKLQNGTKLMLLIATDTTNAEKIWNETFK